MYEKVKHFPGNGYEIDQNLMDLHFFGCRCSFCEKLLKILFPCATESLQYQKLLFFNTNLETSQKYEWKSFYSKQKIK